MKIDLLGVANGDTLIFDFINQTFTQYKIPFIDHPDTSLPNFIIALTGQSNSQGYKSSYDPTNYFDQPKSNIFGWNIVTQKWEIADLRTESLGINYETFKQLGTNLSAFHFAQRLIEAYPTIRPGIINFGVSGASIALWTDYGPNEKYYNLTQKILDYYEGMDTFPDYKKKPQGFIFDYHISQITLALNKLPVINRIVNALVWDQGETDNDLAYYDSSIKRVLQRYKNYFSYLGFYNPNLFGFIAISTSGIIYLTKNPVNDILKKFSMDGDPFTKYVDCTDLPEAIDNGVVDIYHFDTASQREIGTRCFKLYRDIFSLT